MPNDSDNVLSQLIEACEDDDLETVQRLILAEPALVNKMDPESEIAPLHAACRFSNLKIVQFLLSNGADPNLYTDNLDPPLCGTYKTAIVKALFEKGANPNLPDANGVTPFSKLLTNLPRNLSLNIAQYLKNGGDPFIISNEGLSTFDIAIREGIFAKLIQKFTTLAPNHPKMTKLIEYFASGNVDEVQKLIDAGLDVNGPFVGNISLLYAAHGLKKDEMINLLLRNGASKISAKSDNENLSDLLMACASGDFDAVKEIITEAPHLINQVDVNTDLTALQMACYENYTDIALLLLENGADPNAQMGVFSPISLAVKKNNIEIVEILMNHHVYIETQEEQPFSHPLILAKSPVIKSLLENYIDSDEYQQRYKLASAYRASLRQISQMIILGIDSEAPKGNQRHIYGGGYNFFIRNTQGYGGEETMGAKGQALSLNFKGKEYPIGYIMNVPDYQPTIDNIVISVYGGDTSKDLNFERLSGATQLQYLVDFKGCAVINLLLPDLLQDTSQFNMTEEFHEVIHACINHFYEALKHNPASFHPKLANTGIESAKFYLQGESFGGRTAIRHGQLFPHTFDGYISHDGALDTSMKSDMPIMGKRRYSNDIVNPTTYIADTVDPVLILQNRDDNNVNIGQALEFYDGLKAHGKSDLARLCFFEKGNVMHGKDAPSKGHFLPPDRDSYFETMFQFMQNGPSVIPELHMMSHMIQQRFAKLFHRNADIKERFLALAHQKFDYNPTHQAAFKNTASITQWDTIWHNEYEPIFIAQHEIQKMSADDAYLKKQLDYLVETNLLTDDVIEQAIKSQSNVFREFLKEAHGIVASEQDIMRDPMIKTFYKQMLLNLGQQSVHIKYHMLESLYFSNPQLILSQASTLEPDNIASLNTLQSEYRDIFERQLNTLRQTIRRTWQATANKVQAKEALLIDAAKLALENANMPDIAGCLFKSASEGLPNALNYLLDHGASPDITDDKGHNALFYAAINGNLSEAKLLISRGATVDIPKIEALAKKQGFEGVSPFKFHQYTEIINYLKQTAHEPNHRTRPSGSSS